MVTELFIRDKKLNISLVFITQTMKICKISPKNMRYHLKISSGQGDDYTSDCLLDYTYFKNYYKLIATDLSKQHKNMMLIQKQCRKLILLEI